MPYYFAAPWSVLIDIRARLTEVMRNPKAPMAQRINAAGLLLNAFPNDQQYIDECELPPVHVTHEAGCVIVSTVGAGLGPWGISTGFNSQIVRDRYRAVSH